MNRLRSLSLIFSCAALGSADAAEPEFDIVIYGGTAAGVAAAVQSARMGRSVVVIEPGRHLGGLTSGGLGMTDTGNKEVIGGIAREFYRRVKKYYADDTAWRWEKREDHKPFAESSDALWRFEPHVAEQIFEAMLSEAKVTVVKGERLDRSGRPDRESTAIRSIRMESGREFRGRRFIDATYEGDLMALAGVRYHVGRESGDTYDEPLNGVRTKLATKHQFNADVDPYVVPGDPKSGLLFGVQAEPPGTEGAGDRRVQAYNFRLPLTDVPENRVPFARPADYDPKRYELLRRYMARGFDGMLQLYHLMPNRKTDTNNDGAFSSDFIGASYDYPEGDYATRERIVREHESYQRGWLYFLTHDPGVPQPLREKYGRWGLSRDEFTDNGNWPHQIYVREARRMISDWVHTEHDCRRTRETPEPVGMGSYNMDSHNVQRYVDTRGFARNEGDIQMSPGGPYPISYGSIRPKAGECTNLLVPVCCSASHIAYGSIRMEPVFMILGQSAATAACLSLDAAIPVQDVPYEKLRTRLLADGQVLEWKRPATGAGRDPRSFRGTVIDDDQATLSGTWQESTAISGFVGRGYRHTQSPDATARFRSTVARSGPHAIGVGWTVSSNRATRVPVTVTIDGTPAVTAAVDQTRPAGPDGFSPVGAVNARAGQTIEVGIAAAPSGYTIIDAIQVVPPQVRE